ncbi:MAG: glutamate ligase domain-containing protein, partial [Bacteroidia bacterium]
VKLKWKSKDDNRNWDDIETIETKIIGGYNFINCMAAICIGNYFGVEGEKIGEAISEYTPEMNRSQLIQKGSNAIVLDAYNANPTSMAIAINNFNKMKNENKWLFLGDMFELGESSETEHKRIIQLCEELKLKNVVLVGKEFSKLKSEYKSFEKTEDCFKYLKSFTINDSSILIKGSRSMKMETLLDAL